MGQPKLLLPVAGRPMVDHVLASLGVIAPIDEAFVVTNEKFAGHFEAWAGSRAPSGFAAPVRVVNDHSASAENTSGIEFNITIRDKGFTIATILRDSCESDR